LEKLGSDSRDLLKSLVEGSEDLSLRKPQNTNSTAECGLACKMLYKFTKVASMH
jgi:hypothetical protein